MPTLTITKGLPASGKSTWAKEEVRKSNGTIKRVNKDDLRNMLDSGEWSRDREKVTKLVERSIVTNLVFEGLDVIVDNTHLGGDHEEYYQNLAMDNGYFFEVKDFTDVPLQTCIDRDSARENSVGKKAILRMYNQFLKPNRIVGYVEPMKKNPELPDCLIVDIDGTLAHMNGRNPYDYSKVSTDMVDEVVRDIVLKYRKQDPIDIHPEAYIVIVSGRNDDCRKETIEWLQSNNIPVDEIHMRVTGDQRNDAIVKKEIYEKWIKDRYNVRFVLDDRNRVVDMWREQGLKCLQVQPGDF